MEEEEDDLYGENGTAPNEPINNAPVSDGDDDEEEEMDEDDSDDSDIEIVTERKEGDVPAVCVSSIARDDHGDVHRYNQLT